MANEKKNNVVAKPVYCDAFKDGKTRKLELGFNAFVELEEKFGSIKAAMELLNPESGKYLKMARTMIWLAIDGEGEGLTEKQVGDLIDFSKTKELMEKITECIHTSLPQQGKDEKNG